MCRMSAISLLEPIEGRFEWAKAHVWLEKNWVLSVYCSAVYVALVFLGRRWMRDKPAYFLRRPLAMWDTGLAAFSILGFLTLAPNLAQNVRENGFAYSACNDCMFAHPPRALWGMLFLFSKLVEFGDTFFVVLRKTPLNVLHWYHHVSVFVYSAYGITPVNALSNWFATANLFVHSIMYTYYALKASGLRVPSVVAQLITILQLAQFVLGLTVLAVAYVHKSSGAPCDAWDGVLYAGIIISSSYFTLFSNFFYQRYINK